MQRQDVMQLWRLKVSKCLVNIICGAPHHHKQAIGYESETMINIGVDRGALFALQQGLPLHHAVGDFDSLSEEELAYVQRNCEAVRVLSPQKDETDTEVAIELAKTYEPSAIHFYYALGGRLDHSFANINLLRQLVHQGFDAKLKSPSNELMLLMPGTYEFTHFNQPYISFFADVHVSNLCLKGFKYELAHYELKTTDIRCISNEQLEEKMVVSFDEGQLMMINSAD